MTVTQQSLMMHPRAVTEPAENEDDDDDDDDDDDHDDDVHEP